MLFFHWLNLDALVILLLILSTIVLLILPILDLVGLISRQVGLLAKFGLWSSSVMNASLLAVMSTLSSMPSFVAMFLFSEWMACVVLGYPFCRTLWYFALVDRCMLTILVCKSSLFSQRRWVAWFRFLYVWCRLWVCWGKGCLPVWISSIVSFLACRLQIPLTRRSEGGSW